MKHFQEKNEADQENYELNGWEYCLKINRFKKSYTFNNVNSKQFCNFTIFLSKLCTDEFKIFSDVKGNRRNVYVDIRKELDDNQINEILYFIDEAFEVATNGR